MSKPKLENEPKPEVNTEHKEIQTNIQPEIKDVPNAQTTAAVIQREPQPVAALGAVDDARIKDVCHKMSCLTATVHSMEDELDSMQQEVDRLSQQASDKVDLEYVSKVKVIYIQTSVFWTDPYRT